jgi:hypothetical protein
MLKPGEELELLLRGAGPLVASTPLVAAVKAADACSEVAVGAEAAQPSSYTLWADPGWRGRGVGIEALQGAPLEGREEGAVGFLRHLAVVLEEAEEGAVAAKAPPRGRHRPRAALGSSMTSMRKVSAPLESSDSVGRALG